MFYCKWDVLLYDVDFFPTQFPPLIWSLVAVSRQMQVTLYFMYRYHHRHYRWEFLKPISVESALSIFFVCGSTYVYNLDELLFVFFNWYFRLDWHFFCLIILDTNQFFLTIFDMYKMFIALKPRIAFFIKEIYFLYIFLLSIDTI